MVDLVEELRGRAARLPTGGAPLFRQARQRAVDAAEAVATALTVDPTLTEHQVRNLDLLAELLRQLVPLARQAGLELERRRLTAAAATEREIARLGRTNPLAPQEVEALSERCTVIAADITAAALPDWNTPRRIRERSEQRLPSEAELEAIADQLRRAVKASLELPYPAPEAVRLAVLADQIAPIHGVPRRCAGPGCDRELEPAATGRPRLYCGPTCRQRARRLSMSRQGD